MNSCIHMGEEFMKLSIITINYNNKEGLQKTIDSVIGQTWTDFEWIVIDGGSTDGGKELIERYQQHFAYWCSEPDKGVYNAMNKGINHAQGEYLLFLNSGDALYEKDTLLKVDDLKLDADVISGQVERMDNQQPLRFYDKSILMQLYLDTLNHQGTFIKRSLFNDLRYDENLRIVSDWKFWLETIVWRNASVETIALFVARQDMTGISNIMNPELSQERDSIKLKYFPPLLQKELDNTLHIRNSIYNIRGEYLMQNSDFFYCLGARILGVFVRIVKLFVKK